MQQVNDDSPFLQWESLKSRLFFTVKAHHADKCQFSLVKVEPDQPARIPVTQNRSSDITVAHSFNGEASERDGEGETLLTGSVVCFVLFWCDLMMHSHPWLSAIFHSLRDAIKRSCFSLHRCSKTFLLPNMKTFFLPNFSWRLFTSSKW